MQFSKFSNLSGLSPSIQFSPNANVYKQHLLEKNKVKIHKLENANIKIR